MFSEKKDKKDRTPLEPSSNQNRINDGTIIKGDITSSGFFRIDGVVEGNISKPSRVVLGKSGKIMGTLTCEEADIEGVFEGELNVTGTLSLKSTAHIEGTVVVGKLSVEPGATFNATCSMHGGKAVKTTEEKSSPYDRQHRLKKQTEPLK